MGLIKNIYHEYLEPKEKFSVTLVPFQVFGVGKTAFSTRSNAIMMYFNIASNIWDLQKVGAKNVESIFLKLFTI